MLLFLISSPSNIIKKKKKKLTKLLIEATVDCIGGKILKYRNLFFCTNKI